MTHNKPDDNQAEIVKYLRSKGAKVKIATGVRKLGFDLLVFVHGGTYPCEVKDGSKPLSEQKLTPNEQAVHKELAQVGVVVWILRSLTDCDELLEWMRND